MSRSGQLTAMVAVCVALLLALTALPAQAQEIEDYAPYQPQTKCAPKAKPVTKVMLAYVVETYGGAAGGISRPCAGSGTSEHKEGRALDWTLDATKKADRKKARAFLAAIFAADDAGNEDALDRRMGIMYVIWDDHIYSAWRQFEPADYLSSSCKSLRRCSKTLRHRDHLHVSLTRAAGKGRTSWYADRL